MSPFLTTLGGGSTRGFGRAFRRITALLGPTSAPTSLSAPSIAGTSVQLSWTNTDNISQIRVYRGASLVTTLSAGSTSYTNTGLSQVTSYSFNVRYFKNTIEGSASNTASITTLSCPSAGTQVSYYCSDCTAYVTRNDGNCGTYQSTESNSAQCCAYLGYDVGSLGSVSIGTLSGTGYGNQAFVYGGFCSTGAGYAMYGELWVYRHSDGTFWSAGTYDYQELYYSAGCTTTANLQVRPYTNIGWGLITVTMTGRFEGLGRGGQPDIYLGGSNYFFAYRGYQDFTISTQTQYYF